MKLASLALAAPILFVIACSGDDSTATADADAGNDATASDASTQDAIAVDSAVADSAASDSSASDAAQACNAVGNVATTIPMDYVASAPPTAQGGTIADGTYTMTAAGFYTGVGGVAGTSGITGRVTIQITATTIQVVTTGTPPSDHVTTTIATNGSAFTRTDTCPDTTSQQGTYTATSTTFTVILPAGTFPDGGVKTLVETFTKQ